MRLDHLICAPCLAQPGQIIIISYEQKSSKLKVTAIDWLPRAAAQKGISSSFVHQSHSLAHLLFLATPYQENLLQCTSN